ncbi:omwaprin-a-like [Gastrophryne carolinensis]
MRTSTAVAITALLLGMVLLQAVTAVVKSGNCPPFMPAGAHIRMKCIDIDITECERDEMCLDKKKCCPEFCKNHCRDPVDTV